MSPFVQRPCLKKRQRTDFGSAPADTFCVWTGLKRASRAAFSFSRSTFSFYRDISKEKRSYKRVITNPSSLLEYKIPTIQLVSRYFRPHPLDTILHVVPCGNTTHHVLNCYIPLLGKLLPLSVVNKRNIDLIRDHHTVLLWDENTFCMLCPPYLTCWVTFLINCCCFFPFLFFRPKVLSCRQMKYQHTWYTSRYMWALFFQLMPTSVLHNRAQTRQN